MSKTDLTIPQPGISTTGTGSPFLSLGSAGIGDISGVDPEDMQIINRLLKVWRDKYTGNIIRSMYVDAHERFKDFGISIPDRIKTRVSPMIGWPAKAVRSLADLSEFEGFDVDQSDRFGVREIVEDNSLLSDVPQLISSAYTHSCSFLTVAADPDDAGRIQLVPRSADWSSAIWDGEHRRISAALTITSGDEKGRITGFNVWLPGKVYVCSGSVLPWHASVLETNYPRATVVPFFYDPQIGRPFGRSRVSRTLMSLTDIGFRTVVRMEASAEFYSVPKLWFVGADRDAFSDDTWSSLVSAINAISKDEDGDRPDIKQISQASMQPHSDMLRTIALLVSSETNIPVSDLGITTDNPASAEAMAASERKLTREADRQNVIFSKALKDAVGMAVCLRDGLRSVPAEFSDIHAVWSPTREVSNTARADAFSKIAQVAPAFAQTGVGWRYAGFSQDETTEIMTQIRRGNAMDVLDRLTGGGDQEDDKQTGRAGAQ